MAATNRVIGIIPQSEVEFDTREFEFSHGHTPRGRGCWAFDYGEGEVFIKAADGLSSLFYSDAKVIARRLAAERGVWCVKVCP